MGKKYWHLQGERDGRLVYIEFGRTFILTIGTGQFQLIV